MAIDVSSGRSVRSGQSRWLSLSQASLILGITPGTLRRWVDRGQISAFTTPGGHRRFPRAAIQALVPSPHPRRPTLERLGASLERISRAYRRPQPAGKTLTASWLAGLSELQRAAFRERGRRLVESLLEYLDAADSDLGRARLEEATRDAEEQGRQTALAGASLEEAVASFLRYRTPFVTELAGIARRRRLDTRQATALLVEAEAAMDRLLVALMAGHASHAHGRRRR